MANDKRFLSKEKLFNLSRGELLNYHEELVKKYKNASPKMKQNYFSQISAVEKEITRRDTRTSKPHKSKNVFSTIYIVLAIVLLICAFLLIPVFGIFDIIFFIVSFLCFYLSFKYKGK